MIQNEKDRTEKAKEEMMMEGKSSKNMSRSSLWLDPLRIQL
jgi:hypothetical protein